MGYKDKPSKAHHGGWKRVLAEHQAATANRKLFCWLTAVMVLPT
jgi:hypothetical protein